MRMQDAGIPDTQRVTYAPDTLSEPLPSKAIAIIAFVEDLARRGAVMDQKTIARQLGMAESTLSRYVNTYGEVEAALRSVLPLSASRKVVRALEALRKEGAVITPALVAERADVSPDTVSRVKAEDPELGRQIGAAMAASLYNRIEALIRERNSQGLEVTQKWLADELGVSESAIVNYKNTDPAIYRLIEDARPLSAVEKVRAAVEDLKAEHIPPTIAHIVDRAGIHQGTVSKVKRQNAELAQAIVNAPPAFTPVDRRQAEEQLAARIQLYGDERCNTVSALDRSQSKGGNRALLRACRRLEIVLPRAQPKEVDSLVSYLNRIADTKPLFEEEAANLWRKAKDGDREAVEELLVRTRPLVTFVIKNTLHEDIDPSDFKSNLIEHLISQGDFIITDNWDKWDGKGGILWYFGRVLGDGLREARLSYYYRRKVEERLLCSIQAPLMASDTEDQPFTLESTRQLESTALSPDVTVGILNDVFPFDEDELVARRDAASGLSVVLPLNKQVMAAALKEVFRAPELAAAFESGVRNDWALFMAGSTGKLGTAILGDCAAHLILLTEATDIFTRKTVSVIAGWLLGRLDEHEGSLPSIVIGRGGDYDRIMKRVSTGGERHRVLRKFVAALNKFGVGLSPQHGIATIDVATLGPAAGVISHIPETELFFQTAKNGIRIAASRDGAHKALIKTLMVRMSRLDIAESAASALETANEVLEFELSFLEAQKALIDTVRAGRAMSRGNSKP